MKKNQPHQIINHINILPLLFLMLVFLKQILKFSTKAKRIVCFVIMCLMFQNLQAQWPGAVQIYATQITADTCLRNTGSFSVQLAPRSPGYSAITVQSSTFPFQQYQPNSINSSLFENLPAGVYDVTPVPSDPNGFATPEIVVIDYVSNIHSNSQITQPICNTNGFISVNPTDGVAPYTYLWNTTSTASSISILPGTYTASVRITGNDGCYLDELFQVYTPPNSLTLNPQIIQPTCSLNGSIVLNATGVAPYTYLWNNNATTPTMSIAAGNYTMSVTVTGNDGCVQTQPFTIQTNQNPHIVINSCDNYTNNGIVYTQSAIVTENLSVSGCTENRTTHINIYPSNNLQLNSSHNIFNCNDSSLLSISGNNDNHIQNINWLRNGVSIGNTQSNILTTTAGGNGYGNSINQFKNPLGIAYDDQGNMYVSDYYNYRVLKFPPNSTSGSNGVVIAGGNGYGSALNQLTSAAGLFVQGNFLYVCDYNNRRVMKYPTNPSTFTGAGVIAATNGLSLVNEVFVTASGELYVSEHIQCRVTKFPANSDELTQGIVVAGSTVGSIASTSGAISGSALNQLNNPVGIWVMANGDLYIADRHNHRIVKWAAGATSGVIVAGGNGQGSALNQFNHPVDMAFDAAGNMYVSEEQGARVLYFQPNSSSFSYGAIYMNNNLLSHVGHIAFDSNGDLNTADGGNNRVVKLDKVLDKWVYETGTYTAEVVMDNGCTVAVGPINITSNVNPTRDTIHLNSCSQVLYKNIAYNSTIHFNDTIRRVIDNCDSIYRYVNININAPSTSTNNQTICTNALPYTWNGNSYNAAGTYTVTLTNAAGCDSVATLNLTTNVCTVNDSSNACGSYAQVKFMKNNLSFHSGLINSRGSLLVTGLNSNGQLGIGNLTGQGLFITQSAANNWQEIAGGHYFSVGVKNDGTLWTWGWNNQGQLGDGTLIDKITPQQVGTSSNWLSVSCGSAFVAAIKTDGTLWTWGWNMFGQLGNGSSNNSAIPQQVGTNNDWAKVSCGLHHVVAIKTDGTLWTWGWNNYGQLGDGTNSNKYIPTQVGTSNSWSTITAGSLHSTAIKTNGTLWVWGDNSYGALGNGTTVNENVPIQVGSATNWTKIECGSSHNLGLQSNNSLWVWGSNTSGQIGDGSVSTNRLTPLQIQPATQWANIGAGNSHSFAIDVNGCLYGWGWNLHGALGDGTFVDKFLPTIIDCHPNATSSTTNQTICTSALPYTWNGNSYSVAGAYTVTLSNAAGCDSVATLNLTTNVCCVNTSSTTNVSICTSALPYTWNGTSYNTAGTYTATFTNAAGCDSIATLNITAKNNCCITTYSTTNQSFCFTKNPFNWNGSNYYTSGTYTVKLVNANGCDSMATLNLIVGTPTSSTTTETACDSYTWNGYTYTTSGTYNFNTINSNGCDSIATLFLTINASPVVTLSTTSSPCDNPKILSLAGVPVGATVQWLLNNQTFNTTGISNTGISTLASGLNGPVHIAKDAAGNIYVADYNNDRIIKIAATTNTVTVVAGGNGRGNAANQLNQPCGVSLDGNDLIITDHLNHRIVRWTIGASSGATIAGNGFAAATSHQLNYPLNAIVDASGNLYVADRNNHRIQKFAPGATNGVTVAGGTGQGTALNQLNLPNDIDLDINGDLIISDRLNARILRWKLGDAQGTIEAATGLSEPLAVYIAPNGTKYITDVVNNTVTKWNVGATTGNIVVGNAQSILNYPSGVTIANDGCVVVSQYNDNSVKKYCGATNSISTTTAGTYTATIIANGCTTTAGPLVVDISSILVRDTVRLSGCGKVTNPYNNSGYTSNTTLIDTLKSTNNCDSLIRVVVITVTPWSNVNNTINIDSCGRAQFRGMVYNQSTVLQWSVVDSLNCTKFDTTVNINITPWTIEEITTTYAGCGSVQVGDIIYTSDTTLYDTITKPTGCVKNVYITIIDVRPYQYNVTTTNLFGCGSVTHNGIVYTQSKVLSDTTDVSVDTLCKKNVYTVNITVTPWTIIDTTIRLNGCGSITYKDNVYTTSTTLNSTSQNTTTCTKTNTTVIITVTPWVVYNDTTRLNGCDSVIFNTVIYRNNDTIRTTNVREDSCLTRNRVVIITVNPSPVFTLTNTSGVCDRPQNISVNVVGGTNGQTITWTFNGNSYNPTITNSLAATTVAGGNNSGSNANQFNSCLGLLLDAQGRIYVGDYLNHRVQRFPANSTSAINGITYAGGNGPGSTSNRFNRPAGMCFDAVGNLYVADYNNTRILRFPPNSTSATQGVVVADQGLGLVNDVFVDDVNRVYAVEHTNNRVQRFPANSTSTTPGVVVAGGANLGNTVNGLNNPVSVFVDANYNVIVADKHNHRVVSYPSNYTATQTTAVPVLAGTGTSGSGVTQLNMPVDVMFDPQGSMYVTEEAGNRIIRFPANSTSGTAGIVVYGNNGTTLSAPYHMAQDALGRIYIAEGGNFRVIRLDSTQTVQVNQTGTYTVTVTNQFGCSSTKTINVTIPPVLVRDTVRLTGCGKVTNPVTNTGYTTSTILRDTSRTANGCDSAIKVTIITVTPWNIINDTVRVSGCSSVLYNNITYTHNDTLRTSIVKIDSCIRRDSTIIITVNQPPVIDIVNTSNVCDSVQTLNINGYTSGSTVQWFKDGVSYTNTSSNLGLGYVTNILVGGVVSYKGNAIDSDGIVYRVKERFENGILTASVIAIPRDTLYKYSSVADNNYKKVYPTITSVQKVALDQQGNIYVLDKNLNAIVKVSPFLSQNSLATIVCQVGLTNPTDFKIDDLGRIYVCDFNTASVIRYPANSTATTIGTIVAGGNGIGTSQKQLNTPEHIFIDKNYNVFVADYLHSKIHLFTPSYTSSNSVVGYAAQVSSLGHSDIVIDSKGDLYFANANVRALFKIEKIENKIINNLPLSQSQILYANPTMVNTYPGSISIINLAIDKDDNVYLCQNENEFMGIFRVQKSKFNVTESGTYTATVTDANGCTSTDTIVVTIPPVVVKDTNNVITGCGSVIRNGITYIRDTVIATDTLKTVVNHCDSVIHFTRIIVNQPPVVSLQNVTSKPCSNPQTIRVNGAGNSSSIQWSFNGNVISTVNRIFNTAATTVAGITDVPDNLLTNLRNPHNVTVRGNNMFIADWNNHRILRWTIGATQGTMLAGTGVAGTALNQLNQPNDVFVDANNNLFIAEYGGNRVVRWANGATQGTVIAGTGVAGSNINRFNFPRGLDLDNQANLYVSDAGNRSMKFFTPNSLNATVVGGGSLGAGLSQTRNPAQLRLAPNGEFFIADQNNNRILRYPAVNATNPQNQAATLVADGLIAPWGVALDGAGNIYVAETGMHRIVRYAAGTTGATTLGTIIAGTTTGQSGSTATSLDAPAGIFIDALGRLFVADDNNHRIQMFTSTIDSNLTVNQSGTYTVTVTDANGCTTTSSIYVSVVYPTARAVSIIACNSYTHRGVVYTKDVKVKDTLRSVNGCDSVLIETSVTISKNLTPSLSILVRGSDIVCKGSNLSIKAFPVNGGTNPQYQWTVNGVPVAGATGVYFISNTLNNGDTIRCILTSNYPCLTTNNVVSGYIIARIAAPTFRQVNISGCNSVTVNNITYQNSAIVLDTVRNNIGCDSIVTTTNITINKVNAETRTNNIVGCNSVVYNGVIYINSTILKDTLRSTQGCDSLYRINNIVVTKVIAVTNVTNLSGCGSVSIGNKKYTTSIVLRDTTKSVLGCDSVYNITNIVVTTPATPTITINATQTAVCLYVPITLTASVTNGGSSPQYQWYKNGVLISGATAATLNQTYAGINNQTFVYSCVLTSNATCISSQTATSNNLSIAVGTNSSALAAISIAANQTNICSTATVIFTATATNGGTNPQYQWKKNSVNISGATGATYSTANISNNDVFTCSLISNLSCVNNQNVLSNGITITVNASSIVTVVNDGSIIVPASVQLNIPTPISTTNPAGGIWSAEYGTIANGNITFSQNLSGENRVFYQLPNQISKCTTNYRYGVYVFRLPTPLTGNTALCSLGSTTTISTTSMNTGVWTSSNPSVASVTYTQSLSNRSATITALSAGTATISYLMYVPGGFAPSVSTTITVAPVSVAPIIGNSSICIGSTTQLTNATPNGVWSSIFGRASVNANGLITGVSAGVAEIRYTVNNAATGCSAYAVKNVTVNAIPSVPTITYAPTTLDPQAGAGTGQFCLNRTFDVVGFPLGGTWTSSNTNIMTVTNLGTINTIGLGFGTLNYRITTNGCSNSRNMSGTVVGCAVKGVSINNEQLVMSNDFTMYPNPAKSAVNINVETLVGKGSIVITDILGKVVKTQNLSMGTNILNVTNLTTGMYFVSMITAAGKTTKKMIVE